MEGLIIWGLLISGPFVAVWLNGEWRKYLQKRIQAELHHELQQRKRELEIAALQNQSQLAQERQAFEDEKRQEEELIKNLQYQFSTNILAGRVWAAEYLAEIYAKRHDLIAYNLQMKKRAAFSAAEAIKSMRSEKKKLVAENILLHQKIKLYQRYFPFLVDLDEEIMCNPSQEFDQTDGIDKDFDNVRKYLTADEYAKLTVTQRNQLALNRYLSGHLSDAQIGRLYETFLGWLYEKQGYQVTYNGIEQGVEDMGRDLICEKSTETLIVQAKCWARTKAIHERHVFQLYGTTCLYKIEHPEVKKVRAFLYVTNQLSQTAREAAQMLKIKVEENFALDKNFPMIKCNIGKTGEKIYHLPFDQQYHKTLIQKPGEMYCHTVAEAESNGFRRAKRFFSSPRAPCSVS